MTQQRLRKIGAIGTVVLVLGLLIGVAPRMAMAAPSAQNGPTTWTVLAGGQAEVTQTDAGPAGAWQFLRFYPDKITINVGDTIIWKLNSAEMHTVTMSQPQDNFAGLIIPEPGNTGNMMFNPQAVYPQGGSSYDGTVFTGSGQIGGGPSFPTEYQLTFTQEGTWDYFCAFHSVMTGTVVVQAAGSAYPQTQADIDAAAQAQLQADTQAAMAAEAQAQQVSTEPGPNGTTIHHVNVGYGNGTMAYMRFSPQDITVQAGDTIEWDQKDVEAPHTVTFVSGGTEPELVLPQQQPSGPPNLILNPDVLNPAGGSTYSGQGYFNSGFMWGTEVPLPGPRTYSLVFDTPGTYDYMCVLHDPLGMVGTVTVLAAQAAPAATPSSLPTTGGPGGIAPGWWILVAAGGVALAAGLGLAALRRGSGA
jgi:plastocyanin